MSYTSRLLFVVVCLACFVGLALGAPAWAQNPTIYVSGGGYIWSVSGGVASPLVAGNYQGLVVGPDNADANNPAYLLYACDPTDNTIIRFDPNAKNPAAGVETVYSGGAQGISPQCGRFDDQGDLIVTSENPGSGIWGIQRVANIPLGAGGFSAPTQLGFNGAFSMTQVGQGIAEKNTGPLLIVDTANDDVIEAPYTPGGTFSGTPSVFPLAPSSVIPGPFGIAKLSDGELFVSSSSGKSNTIAHFNADGSGGSTCISLGKKVIPYFMQMSASDTLYVATTITAPSSGAIYALTYSAGACSATQVSTSTTLPPLMGIALPPTTVTAPSKTLFTNQTGQFKFGFAEFDFTAGPATDTGTGCTLSVTADQLNNATNYAFTDSNQGDLFFGGSPGVDLGRDGFRTAFDVIGSSGCDPSANFETVAVQVDNLLVKNPRVASCDPTAGTTCNVLQSYGNYLLSGMLPQDGTYTGRGGTSRHFLIDASQNPEAGQFCGFESPLLPTDPNTGFASGVAGPFSNALSVKFKVASQSGTCQNGPYITDAVALVSVEQILDAKGNSFFQIINIDSTGNSTPLPPPTPPEIKADQNQQYQISLNLKSYTAGTYALTITLLTSQTIQQTVEFRVK